LKSGGVSKGQVRNSKTPIVSVATIQPRPFTSPQVAPTNGPWARVVSMTLAGTTITPSVMLARPRPSLRGDESAEAEPAAQKATRIERTSARAADGVRSTPGRRRGWTEVAR
jgi:hypothetical protein